MTWKKPALPLHKAHKCSSRMQCLIHDGHTVAHIGYLGAVSVYAHGPYAYAAGGLLVFVLAGIIVGIGGGE